MNITNALNQQEQQRQDRRRYVELLLKDDAADATEVARLAGKLGRGPADIATDQREFLAHAKSSEPAAAPARPENWQSLPPFEKLHLGIQEFSAQKQKEQQQEQQRQQASTAEPPAGTVLSPIERIALGLTQSRHNAVWS